MSKTKLEWRSISIPSPLYERIKKIFVLCGFTSVQEYVREAIRGTLRHHEIELQSREEDRFEEIHP